MGMHVPWIQVTQEAWDLANQFAGLTGLTFQEAFTGLIEAWRWGVGLGPETEPPKGICDSLRALDRLASVMRLLKLDRQALADALVELQVIELLPVGLRVRGTRRYWPAWAKNNPDLWRDWKAANSDEFRTRPVTEPSPGDNRPVAVPPDADADADAVKKPPTPTPSAISSAETSTSGRVVVENLDLQGFDSWWDWHNVLRANNGLRPEKRKPKFRDFYELKLLPKCRGDPDLACGTYKAYLRDASIRAEGHPFGVFADDDVWPSRLVPEVFSP